ncbi:hypothetical protein [Yoonia sp.]|uniref:hypothetical protein n=1 Tax=Yoonia sp. TaxID=2212373 RepID=UPI00391D77C3
MKILLKKSKFAGDTRFSLILCGNPDQLLWGAANEGKVLATYNSVEKAQRDLFDKLSVATLDQVKEHTMKKHGSTLGNMKVSQIYLKFFEKYLNADAKTFYVKNDDGDYVASSSKYHRTISDGVMRTYTQGVNGYRLGKNKKHSRKKGQMVFREDKFVVKAIADAYFKKVIDSFGPDQLGMKEKFEQTKIVLEARSNRTEKLVFKNSGRERDTMMAYFDFITIEIANRGLWHVTEDHMFDVVSCVWTKLNNDFRVKNAWRYSGHIFPDSHIDKMNEYIFDDIQKKTNKVIDCVKKVA